ncbi:hypothetical protein PYCC9005_002442 [Savitreella phatthalungensis]
MGTESAVKGATKSKLAAPKAKYLDSLLVAASSGPHGIADIFTHLSTRLKDPTWTIVFKSLIVIHTLIRDTRDDQVLSFMSGSRQFRLTDLQTVGVSPMSDHGRSIHNYGGYLQQRARSFAAIQQDYAKGRSDRSKASGRLRKLSVEKGLLRETEHVQKMISSLVRCKLSENGVEDDVALAAFKLLVADLLILFQVANEGVISVLEHFFEMSRSDAEHALKVYKLFVEQTEDVIVFMSLARSLERALGLTIPNLQHAPTSLGNNLEEYLRDQDFEKNRIEYLSKKGRSGPVEQSTRASIHPTPRRPTSPAAQAAADRVMLPDAVRRQSGNAELIDFFGSIDGGASAQSTQSGTSEHQHKSQYVSHQPDDRPSAIASQQNANPYVNFPISQRQSFNPYAQQQGMPTPIFSPVGLPNQGFVPQTTGFTPQITGYPQGMYQQMQPLGLQSVPVLGQYQPMQDFSNVQSAIGQAEQVRHFQQSALPIQPLSTGSNPFRKSLLPTAMQQGPNPVSTSATGYAIQQQFTGNPFTQRNEQRNGNMTPAQQPLSNSFSPAMPAQITGNPFARRHVEASQTGQFTGMQSNIQPSATDSMQPQQTGGNPFRRSIQPQGMAQPGYVNQ